MNPDSSYLEEAKQNRQHVVPYLHNAARKQALKLYVLIYSTQ